MAHAVYVVQTPGRKPKVIWAARQPAGEDGAWPGLAKLHQLDKHQVVAVLGRGQYQVIGMETPDVPRPDWTNAVRWKLKDAVDFPVDNAAVDVLAVPGAEVDGPPKSVLAVAAAAAHVQPLVDSCADARIGLDAIDIVETGLRNLCALNNDSQRAQALLRVGVADTQLVTTYRGELLQVRHMDVHLSQINDPNEGIRQAAYDRIALEAQRTLDMCERLFSYANLNTLWILPGTGSTGLADYLREVVYVPVMEMPLTELVEITATSGMSKTEDQGAFGPALGAALRMTAGA